MVHQGFSVLEVLLQPAWNFISKRKWNTILISQGQGKGTEWKDFHIDQCCCVIALMWYVYYTVIPNFEESVAL